MVNPTLNVKITWNIYRIRNNKMITNYMNLDSYFNWEIQKRGLKEQNYLIRTRYITYFLLLLWNQTNWPSCSRGIVACLKLSGTIVTNSEFRISTIKLKNSECGKYLGNLEKNSKSMVNH